MSNHPDDSVTSDKPAEGLPEAGSQLILKNVKVEPMETSSEDETSASLQHSPIQLKDIKVEFPIRSRSGYEERRPSINTKICEDNTVCLFNDTTGQSVVVKSHQSTKQALASLSLRENEAKRMERITRISFKKEIDRTIDEKRELQLHLNALESKSRVFQKQKPRVEKVNSTPRTRKTNRSRSRTSSKMCSEEAQALLYSYFNFTDQQKWEMNELLTEDQPIQPYIAKIKASAMWDKMSTYPYQPRFRTQSATSHAIKTEVVTPAISPSFSEPVRHSRNNFNISRFLEPSSSEPSSAPSPVSEAIQIHQPTEPVMNEPELRLDQSKQRLLMQDVANPAGSDERNESTPPAALVINDVSTPLIPEGTSETVVTQPNGPWGIEPAQMVTAESEQQMEPPIHHHCSRSSPVQRSKSTPPYIEDEELIEFLREEIAKEKRNELQQLKKKSRNSSRTQKRNSTKKSRGKFEIKLEIDDEAEYIRSKSTPSVTAMGQYDANGHFKVPNAMESNGMVSDMVSQPRPLTIKEILAKEKALAKQGTPIPVTFVPVKKAAPKRKKPTKAELAAAQGVPIEELPKTKRSPPKKKLLVVDEDVQIIETESHYPEPIIYAPTNPAYQPLPSVTNLLPPTGHSHNQLNHNQLGQQQQHRQHTGAQMNNNMMNGYGYIDVNGGSSSSASSSYVHNNSKKQFTVKPKPQQSMASMLAPLGGFAQTGMNNSGFGENGAGGVDANSRASSTGNAQGSSQLDQNVGNSSGFGQNGSGNYNTNGQQTPRLNRNYSIEGVTGFETRAPMNFGVRNGVEFVQEGTTNYSPSVDAKNPYQYYVPQNTEHGHRKDEYKHAVVHASQLSMNGNYGEYDGLSNSQFHQTEYPPPSVESQLSSQSRDSIAPNSQYSSMPQTPISQHSNNGSLYNTMPVSNDSQLSHSNVQYQQTVHNDRMMTPTPTETEQRRRSVDVSANRELQSNNSGNQYGASFIMGAHDARAQTFVEGVPMQPSIIRSPNIQEPVHQFNHSNRVIQQHPSNTHSGTSHSTPQLLQNNSTCQPMTVVPNGFKPTYDLQANGQRQPIAIDKTVILSPQKAQNLAKDGNSHHIRDYSRSNSKSRLSVEDLPTELDMPIGEFLVQHNSMLANVPESSNMIGHAQRNLVPQQYFPTMVVQQQNQSFGMQQQSEMMKSQQQSQLMMPQSEPQNMESQKPIVPPKKKRIDYRKRKVELARLAAAAVQIAKPDSSQSLENHPGTNQVAISQNSSGSQQISAGSFPINGSGASSNGTASTSAAIPATREGTVLGIIDGVASSSTQDHSLQLHSPKLVNLLTKTSYARPTDKKPRGKQPLAQQVAPENQVDYRVLQDQGMQQHLSIQQQNVINQSRGHQQQVPHQEQMERNGNNLHQPQSIITVPNQNFNRRAEVSQNNEGAVFVTVNSANEKHPHQAPFQQEIQSVSGKKTKKKLMDEAELRDGLTRYKLIKVHQRRRLTKPEMEMLSKLNVPEPEQRRIVAESRQLEKDFLNRQMEENNLQQQNPINQNGAIQHQVQYEQDELIQDELQMEQQPKQQQVLHQMKHPMKQKPMKQQDQKHIYVQDKMKSELNVQSQPMPQQNLSQQNGLSQQPQYQQNEPMQQASQIQQAPIAKKETRNFTKHGIRVTNESGDYIVRYQDVLPVAEEKPTKHQPTAQHNRMPSMQEMQKHQAVQQNGLVHQQFQLGNQMDHQNTMMKHQQQVQAPQQVEMQPHLMQQESIQQPAARMMSPNQPSQPHVQHQHPQTLEQLGMQNQQSVQSLQSIQNQQPMQQEVGRVQQISSSQQQVQHQLIQQQPIHQSVNPTVQKQQVHYHDIRTDQVTVRYVSPPVIQKSAPRQAPPLQRDSSQLSLHRGSSFGSETSAILQPKLAEQLRLNKPENGMLAGDKSESSTVQSVQPPPPPPSKKYQRKKKTVAPVNIQPEPVLAAAPLLKPQHPMQYPLKTQESAATVQPNGSKTGELLRVASQSSLNQDNELNNPPSQSSAVRPMTPATNAIIQSEDPKGKVQNILAMYTEHCKREQERERSPGLYQVYQERIMTPVVPRVVTPVVAPVVIPVVTPPVQVARIPTPIPDPVPTPQSVHEEVIEKVIQQPEEVKTVKTSRAKQIQETLNMVAMPQPPMTEEEFNSDENLVREYGNFFNFNAELVSDLMEDDLYVPEIQLLDVLKHPELEPALHGRFRKRFDLIKAGKTTDVVFPRRFRDPNKNPKARTKSSKAEASAKLSQDNAPVHNPILDDIDLYTQPLSVTTGMSTSSASSSSSQFATPVNNNLSSHQEKSSGQTPLTTPTSFIPQPKTSSDFAFNNLNTFNVSTGSYISPVIANSSLIGYSSKVFPDLPEEAEDLSLIPKDDPMLGPVNIKEEEPDMDLYGFGEQPPQPVLPLPKQRSVFDEPEPVEVITVPDDDTPERDPALPTTPTVKEPCNFATSSMTALGLDVDSMLEPPSSAEHQLINDYGLSLTAPLFDDDPFDPLTDKPEAQDDSDERSSSPGIFDDDSASTLFDNWGQKAWIPIV